MDFAKLLRQIDTIQSKQTLNEGWEDMMKANKEKAKEKGTDKFDKKDVSTGTVYTRKAGTFSDGGDDKDTKKAKEKAKKSKVKEGEEQVEEDEVEEGNEFSGARDAAIKAGQKEFKVGSKTYQVKEGKRPDFLDIDDDGNKDESMADAAKDKKKKIKEAEEEKCDDCEKPVDDCECDDHEHDDDEDEKDEKKKVDESMSECYDQAMGQQEQESGINVSSNMDTKTGNQSLTVTAQGAAADELAQLLKLSGVLGGSKGHSHEMEMDEAEYSNTPHEQVQSMASQMQQGTDLNRPKKTYPRVAGGDNPMQAVSTMEARANAAIAEIEKRLMEQLDAIKVAAPKAKYENSYKKPTAVKHKK